MNSFNTAFLNLRRSPYQSLAAILLLSVTFFVGYVFSLFLLGSNEVLKYFESRPQVIAFFQVDTANETVFEVAEELQTRPYVTDLAVVTKEDALRIYQEENRDDPLLLELVTSQILPASIEVGGASLDDLVRIRQELEAAPGIDEVVLQEDILEALSSWTNSMRLVGFASVGLLTTISLLIMVTIIGMKVVTKRPAITIMRIIGASRWFIRAPFVYEGIIYGMISSIIGWVGAYAALIYLTPWLESFLSAMALFPIQPAFFALQISLGTLTGIFLGALAGAIAVSRVMRK